MPDGPRESLGIVAIRTTKPDEGVFVHAYHTGGSIVLEHHYEDARLTPAEARTFARQLQRLARRVEQRTTGERP